ncbi:hypothetical protein KDD17_11615 [Sulfitobacter albidus]|uniref:Uncharacterized protein n=1 Tax=Sulfitobacter albidus TaxID=2829501 RepID=A0A975JBV9_9RHOB|nr:hypothetical protein [Sulfitobacter albidus]QUJ75601.1 hypothetical protein KDD17_11615 [Sulfitobacter albidus]
MLILRPPDRRLRFLIDPVAFAVALIGGPVIFTLFSFWALFVPIFALAMGGPVYLLLGTPLLMWHLRHNEGDPSDLGWLAFKTMVVGMLAAILAALVTGNEDLFGLGMFYSGFGMIFAPAWAYFFGVIYRRLRRDFYATPRLA